MNIHISVVEVASQWICSNNLSERTKAVRHKRSEHSVQSTLSFAFSSASVCYSILQEMKTILRSFINSLPKKDSTSMHFYCYRILLYPYFDFQCNFVSIFFALQRKTKIKMSKFSEIRYIRYEREEKKSGRWEPSELRFGTLLADFFVYFCKNLRVNPLINPLLLHGTHWWTL